MTDICVHNHSPQMHSQFAPSPIYRRQRSGWECCCFLWNSAVLYFLIHFLVVDSTYNFNSLYVFSRSVRSLPSLQVKKKILNVCASVSVYVHTRAQVCKNVFISFKLCLTSCIGASLLSWKILIIWWTQKTVNYLCLFKCRLSSAICCFGYKNKVLQLYTFETEAKLLSFSHDLWQYIQTVSAYDF